mgnify:CR=1 FL=1
MLFSHVWGVEYAFFLFCKRRHKKPQLLRVKSQVRSRKVSEASLKGVPLSIPQRRLNGFIWEQWDHLNEVVGKLVEMSVIHLQFA